MNSSQRRLQAEWDLLQQLVQQNPGRLSGLSADDHTFHLTLHDTPANLLRQPSLNHATHHIRLHYPPHFPAVPMELYIAQPFRHPNVHPETGFVCLWDRHLVSNTAEHAVHKLVAMLAGRLFNANAPHVMQPEAVQWMHSDGGIQPLTGVLHSDLPSQEVAPQSRRVGDTDTLMFVEKSSRKSRLS